MTATTGGTESPLKRLVTPQGVLTALGLSGVGALFLPFGEFCLFKCTTVVLYQSLLEEVDPRDILSSWWATGLVLPVAISAGYVRWLLSGWLSRWQWGAGYMLALMAASLASLGFLGSWDGELGAWAFVVYGLIAFGAGGWFVIQNARLGVPHGLNALVAMQVVCVPLAVVILLLLMPWHIGGYLAFVAVLVYGAQAALSVRGQPRVVLRLLPLGLWWLPSVGLLVWAWLEG